MEQVFEIPLSPTPQKFLITLGDKEYHLTFLFRQAPEAGWIMNIYGSTENSGEPIVCGIPLVTGTDLLSQYKYLGISGSLYINTENGLSPGFNELGTTAKLYYIPDTSE